MGKIEDEFNREQMARQTPALLRGEGTPAVTPVGPQQQPVQAQRAALLRPPAPPPINAAERLRTAPAGAGGLAQTIAQRAPAVAAPPTGPLGQSMESAAYRASFPPSNSAGYAATVAERATPPADPGIRARLTQQATPGAGLAQTMAGRTASLTPAPSMADPVTVQPNRTPSTPANNPITNPNAAKITGGAVSNEGMAYEASRAGAKIPDQVGVNRNAITGVDAQGRPIANTGPRPTVPNMPPSIAAPERAGLIARLRSGVGLGAAGVADAAPAAPVGAPPPSAPALPGQPGAIRSAAQGALGSGEQWRELGAKVGGKLGGAARVAGAVAKPLAPVLGAAELYQGVRDGDAGKAAWGAADTAAGAALYTPAAPVAGVYLTGRGAWELGKAGGEKLPEGVRDTIGSGINKLVNSAGNLLGQDWGIDNRLATQYANEQQKAASIATAARQATTPAPPAGKSNPRPNSDEGKNKPVTLTSAAAAPQVVSATPAGQAPQQAQPSELITRYRELQAEQLASPIAFTTMGGGQGGTQVHFKDGTVSRVGAGMDIPEELAAFEARQQELNAISTGRSPARPTAPAATPAQPKGGPGENVMAFAQQYGPAAAKAGAALGVDPDLLLAQWGQETGWGKSVIPGTNNLGNIKAGKGQGGTAATDNMTGSRDNYLNFATPEDFADHYAGLVKTRYKGATGAGADMERFAGALKKGGYAEDARYGPKLAAALATLQKYRGAAPPAAGVSLDDLREMGDQPAQMIRGLNQTTLVPNGNGYNEVPQTIFDAANMAGNARAGVNNFLGNVNEGWNNAVNPKGVALDEQAMQNAGALDVARLNSSSNLTSTRMQTEAQKAIAEMNAEAGRGAIVTVPGGESIDPVTRMPIKQPGSAYYMKDGVPTLVAPPPGAAQAQALPAGVKPADVRNNSILIAKRDPTKLAEINASLQKYGLPPLSAIDLK